MPRQFDDVKNDRLPTAASDGFSVSDMDLTALVEGSADLGDVSLAETLMCAKCIGECKIF